MYRIKTSTLSISEIYTLSMWHATGYLKQCQPKTKTNIITHCNTRPSFQSELKLEICKCGCRTALIHANINFFGGVLDCEPIWYFLIKVHIIPRISFRFPDRMSSAPGIINVYQWVTRWTRWRWKITTSTKNTFAMNLYYYKSIKELIIRGDKSIKELIMSELEETSHWNAHWKNFFLTWWPWIFTYDCDLQAWHIYSYFWPTWQKSGLCFRPFGHKNETDRRIDRMTMLKLLHPSVTTGVKIPGFATDLMSVLFVYVAV